MCEIRREKIWKSMTYVYICVRVCIYIKERMYVHMSEKSEKPEWDWIYNRFYESLYVSAYKKVVCEKEKLERVFLSICERDYHKMSILSPEFLCWSLSFQYIFVSRTVGKGLESNDVGSLIMESWPYKKRRKRLAFSLSLSFSLSSSC